MKSFVIWFLLIFLIYPSILLSQDEEKAKNAAKFLEAGIALQNVNNHEEALKNFENALSIMEHPKIKYFKALSLFELKRFKEARTVFEEISKNKKVEKYQKEIETKLQIISEAMKPVPLIIRTTDGQPAKISIDGKLVGYAPYETKSEPGEYVIIVEREGFQPIKKKVKLSAPGPQIEEFTLNLVEVKTAPIKPRPVKTELAISKKIEKPSTTLAWLTLGSGIALFATGGGFMIKHFVDKSNLRGETAEHEADTMSPINAIIGGILMGVGVAAAVTSIFLFPGEEEVREDTSFILIPEVKITHSYKGLSFSYIW